MSNFKKIAPGDFVGIRPDAEFRNATIDTIEAVEGLKKRKSVLDRPCPDPAVVLIKNVTGAALDAFSPVVVQNPIYSRDTTDFYSKGLSFGCELEASKPAGTTSEILAITRGAIPAGGIGYATISGATLCKIQTGAGNYLKTLANDTTRLAQASEGQARIISVSNASGTYADAYILLTNDFGGGGGGCTCAEGVFACLKADLEAGSHVSAKVWPDFSETIEVYAPPLMCDEDTIAKCTMVYASKIGNYYYALIEGGTCNCDCDPYPDECDCRYKKNGEPVIDYDGSHALLMGPYATLREACRAKASIDANAEYAGLRQEFGTDAPLIMRDQKDNCKIYLQWAWYNAETSSTTLDRDLGIVQAKFPSAFYKDYCLSQRCTDCTNNS